MPDTDFDKPGKNPKPSGDGSGGSNAGAQGAPENLDEELDRLLADIEIAVDELDPTGDLEEQAAAAKDLADAGDRVNDEVEGKDEADEPPAADGASERVPADEAALPAESSATSAAPAATGVEDTLDAELDCLIESIPPEVAEAVASGDTAAPPNAPEHAVDGRSTIRPDAEKPTSEERSQIDDELDALLAEAEALIDDDDAPDADAEAGVSAVDAIDETVADPAGAEAEQADGASEPAAASPGSDETGPGASDTVVDDAEKPVEVAAQPVAEPEAAQPDPESSSPGADRSIEDLDADLAAQAETATEDTAEADPEPATDDANDSSAAETDDDAFRSSDDVVEKVIEKHASITEDAAEESGEDADALAQLMAESPASSEMGVAPSEVNPKSKSGDSAEQKVPKADASSKAPALKPETTTRTTDDRAASSAQGEPSRFAPALRRRVLQAAGVAYRQGALEALGSRPAPGP
ncbi:MAG: hypothetical protein ACFHWZ_04990 [Phycisphaerales bacterium]